MGVAKGKWRKRLIKKRVVVTRWSTVTAFRGKREEGKLTRIQKEDKVKENRELDQKTIMKQ